MKNLNQIGIDTNKVLSKEKLINLRGGEENCFHCTCHEIPGEWYGNYDDTGDMASAIATFCGSGGGTCVADEECGAN